MLKFLLLQLVLLLVLLLYLCVSGYMSVCICCFVVGAGPDASKQMEISGVTFVAKDGRSGWRRAWRGKRSVSGLPAQQLDFHIWMMRKSQQQQQQQKEV